MTDNALHFGLCNTKYLKFLQYQRINHLLAAIHENLRIICSEHRLDPAIFAPVQ